MDVSLTPELEKLVQAKVQSGRYNPRATHLKELRSRIDQGLASVRKGEAQRVRGFMQSMLDDLDSREVERNAG